MHAVAAAGQITVTRVPSPGRLWMEHLAPIGLARSCMIAMPKWSDVTAFASNPRPSSRIRSTNRRGEHRRITLIVRAAACFVALLSAS